MTSVQPSAEAHYVQLIHRLRDKGKVLCKEVVTLRHLPGRVFVVASYDEIRVIRMLAGIHSEPCLLPTSDWNHPSLFQPWSTRSITIGSWMRILIPGVYKGDLAYIIGVSQLSDCTLAAVVPRLPPPSHSALPKSQRAVAQTKASTSRRIRTTPALFEPRQFQGLPESHPSSRKVVQNFPAGLAILRQIFDNRFASRDVDDALETVSFNFQEDECVYLYRKRYYFRGLCILPVYGCGALEPAPIPSTLPMTPFAESRIHSSHIDPIFSQGLWQQGDRLSDPHDVPHIICHINMAERTVGVRPTYDIDDEGTFNVPMQAMRRRFRVGDEVMVSAGSNKGRYGLVNFEFNDELTILSDNHQQVDIYDTLDDPV